MGCAENGSGNTPLEIRFRVGRLLGYGSNDSPLRGTKTMPIDIVCSGCQQTLRVPHQFAGRQIKCSICGAIITVPAFSAGTSPAKSASIEKKWYVKDENGQRYGPVPKSELDGWVQ